MDADRYYLDGMIKMSKTDVDILKGMNSNYLTATKDCDYRFLCRLLLCVYGKTDLIKGCVKVDGASNNVNSKYKQLDQIKFNFIKCMFSC